MTVKTGKYEKNKYVHKVVNYNCNLQTIDNYHVRHKIIIGICGIIIVTT